MSCTQFQGLQEKNSSKVLKPPGGGSSDIFGSDNPTTPRSIKNRMQSNIFAAPQTNGGAKNGTGARGQQKSDSHDRLFGEHNRQVTPSKNHMKSSIPIGGQVNGTNGHHANGTNGVAKAANGNGHQNGNGSSSASSASSTNGDAVDMAPPVTRKESSPIKLQRNGKDMASPQMLINQLSPMSQSSSTNTTTSSSSASSLSSSANLDQRKAPNSARSASRLSSSFRRRNPVTGEGCISKDMMIWGGGVGAKKLIGCRSNEEIVVTEGYQRPRKIVQLQRENGNPVTGEGYKAEINTTVPALNGTNQVINKNRIPPGGFSAGLW